MLYRSRPKLSLQKFLKKIAHDIVSGQIELDKQGNESFLRYEFDGILPSSFTWSKYHFEIPCELECYGKKNTTELMELQLSPRLKTNCNLKLIFRYNSKNQCKNKINRNDI